MTCDNYSKENKQCKFNYTPHPFISDKDLNPRCSGKDIGKQNCAWWLYGVDFPANDKLNKYMRDRLRRIMSHD